MSEPRRSHVRLNPGGSDPEPCKQPLRMKRHANKISPRASESKHNTVYNFILAWWGLCPYTDLRACSVSSGLFVTPWTWACQSLLSTELSGQKYWSGLPFPPLGDLPNPGIESASLALAGGYFTTVPAPGAQPFRSPRLPHPTPSPSPSASGMKIPSG